MPSPGAVLRDVEWRAGRHWRKIAGKLPARVTRKGSFDQSHLGRALDKAIRLADSGESRVPTWVLQMSGMSGKRYREAINALVTLIPHPVYMEVGSWSGSTATSAVVGNVCELICIDNWSLFGGPKKEFRANILRANIGNSPVKIIEEDFRQVDFHSLEPKANIYLFDGPHSESDQYDGIVLALPALQERFLLVVDDFNWSRVRSGTRCALTDSGLQIEASIEVRTDRMGFDPVRLNEDSDWHNGYFFAVLTKTAATGAVTESGDLSNKHSRT